MARKLLCDGCGLDELETDEAKLTYTKVRFYKLEAHTYEKEWELCAICRNKVQALIARLPPGSTEPPARIGAHPPHE